MFKKNVIFIITGFFLLILLFGCLSNDAEKQILLHAESLLEIEPDSTLYLLAQIENPEQLSDKDKAFHGLLTTAAKFRTYTEQSDSLILDAVRYYEKKGPEDRLIQAYYYIGGVYYDLQDAPRAQDYYQKALEGGENSPDYALMGKIAGHLGTLYTFQEVYDLAIPYQKKALECFRLVGDSIKQSLVLRDIGRIYSIICVEKDTAIMYYQQALTFSGDSILPSVCNELGALYIQTKEYDSAFYYIRKAIDTSEQQWMHQNYLAYGQLYLANDQLDSARYYLSQSTECPILETKASSYYYLTLLEQQEKNWESSVKMFMQYNELSEQINKQIHTTIVARMESLYNYQHAEQALAKVKLQQARRGIIIIILGILIVCISVGFIYYRKRKKREASEQHQRLQVWKEEHQRNSSAQINENEARIRELELQLIQAAEKEVELLRLRKEKLQLENLQILHFKDERLLLIEKMKQMQIYQKFHILKDFRVTDEDWMGLIKLVDETYDGFTHRLTSLLPKISVVELRICCLLKIGVPPGDIARILMQTKQAVSMSRKRLYEKIHGEEGTADLFDSFIDKL